MRKSKRVTIQPDERRPTKSEATRKRDVEIPTYEGQRKTDKPRPNRERAKAKFERPERPPRAADEQTDRPEQRAKRRRGGAGEQYVRLRVRVRNERLSIVDSHLVDGPLGQVTGFPGSNAYEVTLDGQLLHAGALPDLGVQRSFPNLEGPPDQRGHYITGRDTYEFMARLPADAVTKETLGRITVRLLRVKDEAQAERVGEVPVSAQFERELRSVAEIVGLPESALPEAIEGRGARTARVE